MKKRHGPRRRRTSATIPEHDQDATQPPLIDHQQLAMIVSLGADNPAASADLVATFVDSATQSANRLRDAVDERDADALVHEAHGLNGVALMYALPRLAAVAARLEQMGHAQRLAGATALLDELQRELADGLAALASAAAEPPPDSAGT